MFLDDLAVRSFMNEGGLGWRGELRRDSLLLTLGNRLQPMAHHPSATVDLTDEDQIDAMYGETLIAWHSFTLRRGELALSHADHPVALPRGVGGLIGGLSHMARLGLTVHLDTPIVDAGFHGVLTIEIFNAGPSDVILRPGMPVAKVILYHVGGDAPAGQYHHVFYGNEDTSEVSTRQNPSRRLSRRGNVIDCAFCDEFAQPMEATRIVARTQSRVLVPTIGCLTQGYLLYMPHEHTLAFADLDGAELRECEHDINCLRRVLADRYGPIIVAEHGPRKCDLGAACCDHAHIHLIPVPAPDRVVKEYVKIGGATEPYRTLAECLASVDEAYVYVSPAPAVHYIWPATEFPRQWVRRVCAEIYGKTSQWDWRDHPFDLERQRTYDALVGMSLLPSRML
ncbi:MAG: hypothetical protein QOG18_2534 [Microbacteriaceae bacterium]|nr:hypothetical protein [Microbacteriaceae bacterium]